MNALSIQIRVSLAGPLLAHLDISLLSEKGQVLSIHVEHPIITLLNTLVCSKSATLPDQLQIDNTIANKLAEFAQPEIDNKESQEKHAITILNHLSEIPEFVQQLEEGLLNSSPELCEEGVNGTYFLRDSQGDMRGVFKPADEDLASPKNPKNGEEKEAKMEALQGYLPGEASQREIAAHLLDREGFFGVPRTVLAQIQHPNFNKGETKTGSLQEFVHNDGASWDIGPNQFPVNEVHKIGILDLYMLNLDRHGGNILYKENDDGRIELIPIDHGFSLPDRICVPDLWFEWMNWNQSKKPFDKETLAFIERLNVEQDINMLRTELAIRPECLRVMAISASLLKKGASRGLCLYDIGSIICPRNPSTQSELELLVQSALESMNLESVAAVPEADEKRFLDIVNSSLDKLITSKVQRS